MILRIGRILTSATCTSGSVNGCSILRYCLAVNRPLLLSFVALDDLGNGQKVERWDYGVVQS